MKDFIKKWNNDSRFKAKVKLGLYTSFVVIVSIFAISGNQSNINNQIDTDVNNSNIEDTETITIDVPERYNYNKNITINQKKYQYTGTIEQDKETIAKVVDNVTSNYIYEKNSYYKDESGTYVLTTKEEIYDIIGYNFLKLDTINQYLSKSTKEEEKHLVYLKDIILGNDSEEYITISINENKINIDYTSLMKIFDKTVESYIYEVVIEEIE